jgi:anaerobic selenocysteine-containing dehydrogenase
VADGDIIKVSSTVASFEVKAKLWEGVRPGTVTKCFGQGHWAYGKVAAGDFGKGRPRGGNNNLLMPDDYERLSGSTVRNGGFTGVKIEKA